MNCPFKSKVIFHVKNDYCIKSRARWCISLCILIYPGAKVIFASLWLIGLGARISWYMYDEMCAFAFDIIEIGGEYSMHSWPLLEWSGGWGTFLGYYFYHTSQRSGGVYIRFRMIFTALFKQF
jgi:hypothetical protein